MKKIVLSLAGVMAAVAFAPEASAVPVFARQTGMACSGCHYQHFPLLNGFGRAFKASGFTMMGTQEKVEGEHLSMPSTLNMGVLTTMGYDTTANSAANLNGGNNTWFVPSSGGELSLFFGGRISEFAGFLTEAGMGAIAGTGAAKLPILFDLGGDTRVGVVAHTSNGQGVAYSFELLNTGAVNTHKMTALNGAANYTGVYSASQYLGTNTAATGLSLVAVNPNMGFINVGKWDAAPVGTGNAGSLPLTYIRVAGLFNAAGWDMAAGVQSFSGTSQVNAANFAAFVGIPGAIAPAANFTAKATVVDFQAQGDVAGMGLGVYTSYGTAAGSTAAMGNMLNGGANTRSAWGIGAELGVIPGKATLQLALRRGKNGGAAGADGDNAVQLGATYELAQNMELSLTHMSQSGSAWNAVGPAPVNLGKTATTLMLESLF